VYATIRPGKFNMTGQKGISARKPGSAAGVLIHEAS